MAILLSKILKDIDGVWANASEFAANPVGILVTRPAGLAESKSGEIAFFFNREFQAEVMRASPSVLLTGEPFVPHLLGAKLPGLKNTALIFCKDPYLGMAIVTKLFKALSPYGDLSLPAVRIHVTASVDPTASIGEGSVIGPGCWVGPGAVIGKESELVASVTVGGGVEIGENAFIAANVSIYPNSRLGQGVRLHSGVVIGADGFGYAAVRDPDGIPVGQEKIFHFGGVSIGNRVEIGANSCVDRGTFGDTILEDDVKIDNLVQIGHNAKIRTGAVLCGGVCIAGSAEIGRFVLIGGMTGVTNKVVVEDYAQIGAMSLITKRVEKGTAVAGNPQRAHRAHFRLQAKLNKLLEE